MSFHGRGVTKNTEKAKNWFHKACMQNMEQACLAEKELCKDESHFINQDMAEAGLADANGSPMDNLASLGKIF